MRAINGRICRKRITASACPMTAKYGYGIRDNVMGLSLLKSAKSPDTEADMGEHFFTHALLPPAKGSLGKGDFHQGILLNQPALCVPGATENGWGSSLRKLRHRVYRRRQAGGGRGWLCGSHA